MTLIEKYKDNAKLFKFICESYADCECIDQIEGEIIEGEWCGYGIKDLKTEKKYFIEHGIRGWDYGWFHILNGEPVKIPRPINDDQIHRMFTIFDIICQSNDEVLPDCIKKLQFMCGREKFDELWMLSDHDLIERFNETRSEKK